MILQDIINVISCTFFAIQPLREYNSHERNFVIKYGLCFFGIDAIVFNSNPEFLLHHIIISSALVINLFNPIPIPLYYAYCNTEWSTILLTLMPYISNPSYKKICQLMFAVLFFKFRIYDWYYLFHTEPIPTVYILPLVSMYSLNLYWWVLICKKMCKPLKNGVYHILNHTIVSYTMLMNAGIIIYITAYDYNLVKLTSLFSGITSYLYHNEIAKYHNGIVTNNSKWILLDVVAFHWCHVEYIRHMYPEWFYISSGLHLLNLLYLYKYSPNNISNYSMVALLVDNIYRVWYYPSIDIYTMVLLLGYIHVLNPMYDLSFVATHGVLSWYIVVSTSQLLNIK